MSLNVIDVTKGLFNSQLVSEASNFLGENESNVSKALTGVVPTIVSGLINKTATVEGAGVVTQMISDQHSSWILDNLGNFFNNDGGKFLNKGAALLRGVFDHKLENIISLIANFSGIKSSSSASLLSMALPTALGVISKYNNNNNVVGVAAFLSNQKDNVTAAVPADLNLTSVLGQLGGTGSIAATVAKSTYIGISYESIEKTDKILRILLPTFLILAGAMLVFYFVQGCNGNAGTDAVPANKDSTKNKASQTADLKTNHIAGKIDSITGDWNYDDGELIKIGLPNNMGELEVGRNSTENKLFDFLNNKSLAVDTVKGNWFEFTNVHFKKGGAELTDESMAQLKNMALIAQAYPRARFKFGGYTDSTGTTAINIPLSQKRADAVAEMVIKLGAAQESFVGAVGYGSQWPLQSNATKEGQAQNRRVAVNVKSK